MFTAIGSETTPRFARVSLQQSSPCVPLAPAGNVKFVEVKDGRAFVRFEEAEAATMSACVTEVDGTPVTVTLLTGEGEKEYWDRLWASHDRAAANGGNGGRGGRGGRGGGRGYRGGRGGRGGGRDRRGGGGGRGRDRW